MFGRGGNEEQITFSDGKGQSLENFSGVKTQTPQPVFWTSCRVSAAVIRGGDVEGGLTLCSLLPLETQDLGLSLDVSVNSSAKASGCGLVCSSRANLAVS